MSEEAAAFVPGGGMGVEDDAPDMCCVGADKMVPAWGR